MLAILYRGRGRGTPEGARPHLFLRYWRPAIPPRLPELRHCMTSSSLSIAAKRRRLELWRNPQTEARSAGALREAQTVVCLRPSLSSDSSFLLQSLRDMAGPSKGWTYSRYYPMSPLVSSSFLSHLSGPLFGRRSRFTVLPYAAKQGVVKPPSTKRRRHSPGYARPNFSYPLTSPQPSSVSNSSS
ncbi:hypothetical protein HPP92_022879 [Vanilla planifolia]|uniref:Uncharacterized protein n=1 Tax=Vanilla planifolia TaxID=51239 RepID=A0A835PWI4_VANPL|nr:hypothetical protein HPP92_022879 [Vanilla planifolia]